MIRRLPFVRATWLLVPLIAAGCTTPTGTRYPSLQPRAIESRSDAEPEVPLAIADPDPATDAALAELRKTIDRATTDFDVAAKSADRLATAAKGDTVGGERWIAAQTALAELDEYRATISAALTDLDALALARAAEGKPEYPVLTVLHDSTQATFDAQAERIAAIAARLPAA